MSSRRFFLSSPPTGERAELLGEEAFHLARVLRAEPGRLVELIDGSGAAWSAVVSAVSNERVYLEQVRLLAPGGQAAFQLGLIQSLCKNDKLEWILQKSTELGVAEIFLLEAERCVVRAPRERVAAKLQRWQKIIQAAVKQSRRSTVPRLHAPQPLLSLCGDVRADLRILLSENEHDSTLKRLLRQSRAASAVFCIGPEGGWTAQEQETFHRFAFQPASLGPNILRTETAAVVAAAIIRYELGE